METIKQQTKTFLFCSLIQSHNDMPQTFLSLFYQIPHRGAQDCGETKFPPKQFSFLFLHFQQRLHSPLR